MCSSKAVKWVVSAVLVMTSAEVAAEDGWSMSRLNPFRSRKPPTGVKTRISDQPTGGLSQLPMPKMPRFDQDKGGSPRPRPPKQARNPLSAPSKSPEPSSWTKVTGGAKRFYQQSKRKLSAPWTRQKQQPDPSPRSFLGSRTARAQSPTSSAQQSSPRKPFFSSLLPTSASSGAKPKSQPSRTVPGFLKQPRPK